MPTRWGQRLRVQPGGGQHPLVPRRPDVGQGGLTPRGSHGPSLGAAAAFQAPAVDLRILPSRPGTVRDDSGMFDPFLSRQDQIHGLRRTEAMERRDEHHVALPQGQEFSPRCYSWPCPGCASLFPGFFCLWSGNLARPHLLGDLWGRAGAGSSRHRLWCLCWRQSRALNHARDAPRLGFGCVLDGWQGRASGFQSLHVWVCSEQGPCRFGRQPPSPAATGDLGNLGRNIAISVSVSQPRCPVARAAAASRLLAGIGLGKAALSCGFYSLPCAKSAYPSTRTSESICWK